MGKTFISFIGKGRLDERSGGHGSYMTTQYDFGGGATFRTQCFAEAVRRSGKYTFDEVLFVGTTTASWSTLLENIPEAADLWSELFEREDAKKELLPDSELATALRKALCEAWGKPVRLHLNTPSLLPENAESIFDTYVGELLKSGNDILLDITHGFRWMPILLTSALSFKDALLQSGSDIQVIYGELGGTVSPVRCLDILVSERRIADAVSLFFQKFEPGPLAEHLADHWGKGADAVKVFGTYIQGNLFLPLLFDCKAPGFGPGMPLKRLKNALASFVFEGQPVWVVRVHEQLGRICDRLSGGEPPERLCTLAELLAERKLYGQAILAVCLAAELSLVQAYRLDRFPDYEELQDLKIEFRNHAWSQYDWLKEITDIRNVVAHGGLPGDRANPSPEALPIQYQKILKLHDTLNQYLLGEYQEIVDKLSLRSRSQWKENSK